MMNRLKKWIKRMLLWGIGFPIALILGLYITSEIIYLIIPEKMDTILDRAFTYITGISDLDKMNEDSKLLTTQLDRKNYDSVHVICDSLEGRTKLPPIDLHFYHGVSYIQERKPKVAEYQFKKAITSFTGNAEELTAYAYCVRLLAKLLIDKHDYEGALKVLMPGMKTIKEREANTIMLSPSAGSNLYTMMGNCLVAMGRYDEGERHYKEAIESFKRNQARYMISWDFDTDTVFFDTQLGDAEEAANAYFSQRQYDRAEPWMAVAQDVYPKLEKYCDMNGPTKQRHVFYMALNQARGLHHQGKEAEANKAFQTCLEKFNASWTDVLRDYGQYLLEGHHWQEALDMYQKLDSTQIDPANLTVEDISMMLVPQYKAWRGMGNSQKALAMSDSIASVIDSALVRLRNSDAMELATIYDTQGKEAQIAQKQAALTRLWWIGTTIVLGLIILSFVIYTIYRRRITRMQAVQERIESELRIARDIQMSMVPSVFPEREGLDLYASMTPAKEVGGDLYGYLLLGDKLYFALGDVSGKGVPASLFMAQATRLFLTLAKQGMMPAEICDRMNDALSGDDNESGMFVTFFLGLVDLTTGHLDFCNAGHNPPVIGGGESHGDFLEMIPNAPIGLWPGLEYKGESIDTIKGRPLFIYTDGLNEAENPQQQQFGDERLLNIFRTTRFDSARQVIDTLKAEVEAHRNGADPNDDLTMMCLRL